MESVQSTFCGQTLQAGGRTIGTIGVVNKSGFTAVQRRELLSVRQSAGGGDEIARLHERRQEMVDALVNLRAELDQSEAHAC